MRQRHGHITQVLGKAPHIAAEYSAGPRNRTSGARVALSKLLKREGRAGAEGALLPYVGHLQLILTLKIGADCCQLCQYKLSKPNLT